MIEDNNNTTNNNAPEDFEVISEQPNPVPNPAKNLRTCIICNSQFEPDNEGQSFCKQECEDVYKQRLLNDPIVNYLASQNFHHLILSEIDKSYSDPDVLAKLFKTPDILALHTMISVFDSYDPNKDGEGKKDHIAFTNLLKWIIIKTMTDPVWFSYIGWFWRQIFVYSSPTSNFPLRISPRFHIDNFFTREMPINFIEPNKEVGKPEEVYTRIRNKMKAEKQEKLKDDPIPFTITESKTKGGSK